MRIALVVGLLIATAACGAYRFPGTASGSGTVRGLVVTFGCGGPVQPDASACPAKPTSNCPPHPADPLCGARSVPGLAITFTQGNTSLIATTDSAGAYSIELPVGTWSVSTANPVRIVGGPQTLEVIAGTSIVADYTVDTGMRAAA